MKAAPGLSADRYPEAAEEGHDRAREGRAQARLDTLRPAVIAMLLVTGYPIATRSTCRCKFDLRFPTTRSSSGFRTTSTCSPSTWWTDVFNTLVITVSRWRSSSCSAC